MPYLALTLDIPEALGAAATALAAMAASARMAWGWLTGLVARLQDEQAKARAEFLAETKAARSEFMAEAASSRKDFLQALRELEAGRELFDDRVTVILSGLREILRERGIQPPADTIRP